MKRILLSIIMTISAACCFGQYTGHATISKKVKQRTLVDESKIRFELDSSQVTITAFSENGKLLWKSDPWLDNKLPNYRVERPYIVYFALGKNENTNEEVIRITYNNTQFGTIDRRTGKFTFHGQD
ncbi:MAG TPA: hypothetical protein VGD65_20215 [Chryseosolibacter sp.]